MFGEGLGLGSRGKRSLVGFCASGFVVLLGMADPLNAGASEVAVSNGVISVNDEPGESNAIELELQGFSVVVRDEVAVSAGPGCVQQDENTASCTTLVVSEVRVSAGDLNDTVAVDPAGLGTIGIDLDGGSGSDALDGGLGPETLRGGAGDDEIRGGDGDDRVLFDAGIDQIYGSGGVDTFDLSDQAYARARVDLPGRTATTTIGGVVESESIDGMENVVGTEVPTPGVESSTNLYGGEEPNRFESGVGLTFMGGGGGNDVLVMREDSRGWALPGAGDDQVLRDDNAIKLTVNYSDAPVGIDADLRTGRAEGHGVDYLQNPDVLTLTRFSDRVVGSGRGETVEAYEGNDEFDAGGGDDGWVPGPGDDVANGGLGQDLVEFYDPFVNHQPGVKVDLAEGRAEGQGADELTLFDDVEGTRSHDVIAGTEGPNNLFGLDGYDQITGRGGNDHLHNEHGDKSTLSGGNGDDVLEGGNGANELDGGPGDDRLFGSDHYGDEFLGGPGDDYFAGRKYWDRPMDGDDVLRFSPEVPTVIVSLEEGYAVGEGRDTIFGSPKVMGTSGPDRMIGSKLRGDQFFGEEGPDYIEGNGGNDTLRGGGGADDVAGGEGNDLVEGDEGRDDLRGDAGQDWVRSGDGEVDEVSCGGDEDTAYIDPDDVRADDCELRDYPQNPEVRLLSGPVDGEVIALGRVAWTFAPSDGATILRCEIDGNFTYCADGIVQEEDVSGKVTLKIVVEDLRHDKGVLELEVDAKASFFKVIEFTEVPGKSTTSHRASFKYKASPGMDFACRLDHGPDQTCPEEGVEFTDLGYGGHDLFMRQTDEFGNLGPSASYSWSVVGLGPPKIISSPEGFTNSSTAVFEMDSSGYVALECKIDGGPFESCGSRVEYTQLSEGAHEFGVRGTDANGITSAEGSYSWTTDTVPPETRITPRRTVTRNREPDFNIRAIGEWVPRFHCTIDGEALSPPCDGDISFKNDPLRPGRHVVTVAAEDEVGNVDPTPAELEFKIKRRRR